MQIAATVDSFELRERNAMSLCTIFPGKRVASVRMVRQLIQEGGRVGMLPIVWPISWGAG
jgi:hypothetical protein